MKLVLLRALRHGNWVVDARSALVCCSCRYLQDADTAAGRGGR